MAYAIGMELDLSLALAIFTLVGVAMLGFVLFLSWAVRPLKRREAAEAAYECGYPAQGDARSIGFNYLSYAALFLIFELAALYLFLFAVLDNVPAQATYGFLLGLATLALMILYGTRKRRYYVA